MVFPWESPTARNDMNIVPRSARRTVGGFASFLAWRYAGRRKKEGERRWTRGERSRKVRRGERGENGAGGGGGSGGARRSEVCQITEVRDINDS